MWTHKFSLPSDFSKINMNSFQIVSPLFLSEVAALWTLYASPFLLSLLFCNVCISRVNTACLTRSEEITIASWSY
jgi:hypothetical protein